ncbi:MAG: PQQ-dependent sugar dehydrogenase [Bacteroidia bacterium]|nr:PQQ-dependent sugar dehydrogenase [Bacteroidia bacterium]
MLLFSFFQRGTALLFTGCLLFFTNLTAQPPGFADQWVVSGFNKPEGLAFAPNGLMYVWDKPGVVYVVENGVKLPVPLIDISEEVANHNDLGLSSFALDPDFWTNGYYYLLYNVDRHHLLHYGTPSYNANSNEYNNATLARLTRYTADPANGYKTTLPGSRTIILGDSIGDGIPVTAPSHTAGSLVFMLDKTLMVSVGDSYSGSTASLDYSAQAVTDGIMDSLEAAIGRYRAQYPFTLNGKILRLDPATGEGVSSNPYYDPAFPRSPQSRIWAMGFRNPFRMIYLPGTGDHNPAFGDPGTLMVSDVGHNDREELDMITTGGQNSGWPIFEGVDTNFVNLADLPPSFSAYISNHNLPAFEYSHIGSVSHLTVGGTVYTMGVANPNFGNPASGACSLSGIFYEGTDFPALYRNVYYHIDFNDGWVKAIRLDANNEPDSVYDFIQNGPSIVSMAASPTEPGIFYVDYNAKEVRKIIYAPANLPPTAIAEADTQFGVGPLTVQFDGSKSSDPDNDTLLYAWDFDDGSPINTAINPQHIFSPPSSAPTKYVVRLTVTDDDGESHTDSVVISVNNTPPVIVSVSFDNVYSYSMSGLTSVPLNAIVTDAEHGPSELFYSWQTTLYHSAHNHPEPEDTAKVTTTGLSPIGCDGVLYFYRVSLSVTDAAGLTANSWQDIYPDCGGPIGQTDLLGFTPVMSTVLNVLANDIAGPAPIDKGSVTIITPPLEGTVVVNPVNGLITYDYTGGPDSADHFTYQFEDTLGNLSPVTLVELVRGLPDVLLPVVHLNLRATIAENQVELTGEDPSPENLQQYVVERSSDGKYFKEIISAPGGVSLLGKIFRLYDRMPLNGRNFYRIRRIDSHGNIAYSNQAEVFFAGFTRGLNASVYPNPAEAENSVVIRYYLEDPAQCHLEIFDPRGQKTMKKTRIGNAGENEWRIRTGGLSGGIYLVKITTDIYSETLKLIIR